MDAILPETMTKPEFVAALLQPQAYSHSCADIRLVETHISWVFLTGDFAYKVPVSATKGTGIGELWNHIRAAAFDRPFEASV